MPCRKIVGPDRLILAVRKSRCRGAIAFTLRSVAFPALKLREQILAVRNAFDGDGWFRRNLDWISGFFFFPSSREGLDVSHQICLLLRGKRVPDRHVRVRKSSTNRIDR